MSIDTTFQTNYLLWDKEIKNFKLKYKSKFSDRIKFFFGFYKNDLFSHKKNLRAICQETSQEFSLKKWAKKFDENNLPTISKDKFLKKVIRCKFEAIENRKDSAGFIWKVTNPETQVVHYVIGTAHTSTKNMLRNPALKEAMKNTKLLITELKSARWLLFLRKLEKLMTGSKVKYAVDDELMKLAWKQKKKNLGLETAWEQVKMTTPPRAMNNYFSVIAQAVKRALFKEQIKDYIAVEFWQNGKNFKHFEDIPKYLSKDRNYRWLHDIALKDCDNNQYQGLLELFQNTQNPVCIAVGALHCLGNEKDFGLISSFTHAGFQIERVLPK